MFYGSGAGKLPTASAVVADVIDIAKNLDENIKIGWSKEKLELADINQFKHRFFVRVGKSENSMEHVKEVFGDLEIVRLEDVSDEFAFVTSSMSEQEFKEKSDKLNHVKNVIRVRY